MASQTVWTYMRIAAVAFLGVVLLSASASRFMSAAASNSTDPIFGFHDAAAERSIEAKFLAVPNPKEAKEALRILTQAPHMAGTPEDKATADYVAEKFRAAGLDTQIAEYRVWMNYPVEVSVDATAPADVHMHGPTREHVANDPFQEDARVVMPFNSMSPSGDVEGDVVYANYGTPEDFRKLEEMKVDVRGKLVLVRYGQNFRGVKVLVAQEHGAAGVLIYSDPSDDGWRRGDRYPQGPWRPDSGVQRGSVGYMFQFPGDPTTPGIASVPALPDSKRTPPDQSAQLPKIPCTPISYADAWPLLEHLTGPASPRDWQGSLPFTYHLGPGPVKVKLHLKQDFQYRTIWNVIGRVRGSELPDETVIAGNHRDAWVYGAVDPSSGTVAMLEAVRGIGELLKTGWRPKRTMVFASWDGEEEGLIGSTEWGEQYESEMAKTIAYINVDVAVSGPKFGASSVPSLKQFLRDVARAVPSPQGGTIYDAWSKSAQTPSAAQEAVDSSGSPRRTPQVQARPDAPVGDLGSGSDYTVFLQRMGVPSTDIGSTGSYGVYHSVFDNFQWFQKFADPDFLYEQEMARFYGLEVLRMASVDVLPYDYATYGKEIRSCIEAARKRAANSFGAQAPDFSAALKAAAKIEEQGAKWLAKQKRSGGNAREMNAKLRSVETALLIPEGLPNRPWYRHAIYAPGRYTGYAAVVIPGVNEAIDQKDLPRLRQQVEALTSALNRAAGILAHH